MMFSFTKNKMAFSAVLASAASSAGAFQLASPSLPTKTSLNMVAVDPSTVTKKDYEDICGVSFDDSVMQDRLQSTKFLYPKHVEVIEDIAPIAGEMVDSIVSWSFRHKRWKLVYVTLPLGSGFGFVSRQPNWHH